MVGKETAGLERGQVTQRRHGFPERVWEGGPSSVGASSSVGACLAFEKSLGTQSLQDLPECTLLQCEDLGFGSE